MTLPPTPQPGEVWENDGGERRFVMYADSIEVVHGTTKGLAGYQGTPDAWLGWAVRTNARRILEAPKK